MVPVYVFLFLFSHLPLLLSTGEAGKGKNLKKCPPSFNCGHLGDIRFPFTNTEHHNCGMLAINGCDVPNAVKTVKLKNGKGRELELEVRNIDFRTVSVVDNDQRKRLQSENCTAFWNNIIPPRSSALGYFQIRNNITFFRCNRRLKVSPPKHFVNYTRCVENYVIYFGPGQNPEDSEGPLHACSRVQLPVTNFVFSADPFTFVTGEFAIEAQFSNECNQCFHDRGGQCQLDSKEEFYCDKAAEDKSWAWKLGLGIGLGVAISWILIFVLILCLRLYKRKYALSHVRLRSINTGAGPYQSPDPDSGRLFFGVPIFSYKELEEATNNFDPTRILGDGAFGTVYYGKLQDGREVAVKHLFNHNYRRVERFMNEVEILTHLRHRNLVSLFGCTSRQSSELLLVYEYIPNGTVACHLHGDLAKSTSLPWPTRIKIAIETASALAYLHASDIIHRDVKTNNILLDSSFCVKVADFGLSRLFPNDVSHISTAPQGTPGYVDPEYHNYFQLTSKSDVYSFGVVLIELISSMPAVDMSRHRDEINLANLAIRKIQKSAVNELVDTSLGFESDNEVKRMIVSVAELAFQCLQKDKELRPSIDRVLEVLKRIESGKDKDEHIQEAEVGGDEISRSNVHLHPQLAASPNRDQVRLLMNMKSLSSPNTVTEKWESEYTTPNVSS